MAGIMSYGVHIPRYRIDRSVIYSAMGWLNPASWMAGEKTVANFDEDSLSMAVNAAMSCLNGVDKRTVDGVYFASVTLPYKERQSAAIIATALDLGSNLKTADFTGSTRSGTAALLAALDAVQAGSAGSILVCSADARAGKPGSLQEELYGDGAAAILVGKDTSAVGFRGAHSVSYDFADRWMADFDRFDRLMEDRWVREEGYTKFIPEAISGLAGKLGLSPGDVAGVGYPCLNAREHAGIGKRLGLEPEQVQAHLLDVLGDTGSAYPLILLVSALEDAAPGDNVVIASWGSGSDALCFQAGDRIGEVRNNADSLKARLGSKDMLANYAKYVSLRNIIPVDMGPRAETGIPWEQKALSWRHRRSILGLVGSKCQKCGTPQYPSHRVCVNPHCKAVNMMEPYGFSDKRGHVFSYTEDYLGFTRNPPSIYGMVDFQGGGRGNFELTDCEPGTVKVGTPVEMTFRMKFIDERRGNYFYFWKAVPVRE